MRNLPLASLVALCLSPVACGGKIQPEPSREVALRDAVDGANFSLPDALANAGAEVDGRITGAELEVGDGNPVYVVDVLTADGEVEVEIDPRTGQVLAVEEEGGENEGEQEGEHGGGNQGPGEDSCAGPVASLDAAIAAAEAAAGGTAVSAQVEGCSVQVEILAADGLYEAKVAPDGTVSDIERQEEERGEHEGEGESGNED